MWKKKRSEDNKSDNLLAYWFVGDKNGNAERNEPKRRYEGYDPNKQQPLLNEKEEIYLVRQDHGYCSILFSLVQTSKCVVTRRWDFLRYHCLFSDANLEVILAIMMWQCGVAPMNINPMFGPYPDALSEWGGKNSILILEDGEWWRLGTPILLHAGVIHLLCNIAVQLETGVFFEKEWGSLKWMVVYLSSAVGSSVLSVIVMPNAISVGSSGAVMGLFGGKLAEVILRACERSDTEQERIGHQVRKEQCLAVSCSVIVVMLFSFIPYVDWAAHLGGVVAGFVVGLVTFASDVSHLGLRIFWTLLGTAATVVMFAVSIHYMYSGEVEAAEELRDVCGYYTENFDDYECNCMREEYLANQGGGN